MAIKLVTVEENCFRKIIGPLSNKDLVYFLVRIKINVKVLILVYIVLKVNIIYIPYLKGIYKIVFNSVVYIYTGQTVYLEGVHSTLGVKEENDKLFKENKIKVLSLLSVG